MKSIVAAVDFSRASRKAFSVAARLGHDCNAKIAAVFVLDTTDLRFLLREGLRLRGESSADVKHRVEKYINTQFARLLRAYKRSKIPIETVCLRGTPSLELVRYAKRHKARFIVTGTRGRNAAAEMLLGSTAREVIRSAPCPVVVVGGRSQRLR